MANSVNIDDGGKIIKLVDVSEVSGFPDGTFNGFTVTHKTVVSVVDLVNVFGGISFTASNGETLAEGARSDINESLRRSRVAFKIRVDLSKGKELFLGHETIVRPDGVEEGSSVSLGHDESISSVVLGVLGVVVETRFVEMENSQEFSSRGAGGGVTKSMMKGEGMRA